MDGLAHVAALEVAREAQVRAAEVDDETSQEKASQGHWGRREDVARYKNACDFLLSLIKVCGKKSKCRLPCKHQVDWKSIY
ncbi:hypothetical protein [Anaeromassilibacillus senegalensis]|uniref:hypothetical protein n=1 Tax=Anaeromassilibacillus senegalensis TaxID=1673717 RepID=UPI000683767E|nr:hypothetical protein [Anaeromassilibacillus senegalensis]